MPVVIAIASGGAAGGAYTTFSTFGAETYELTELGHWGIALANVAVSAAVGVAAVALGQALGRLALTQPLASAWRRLKIAHMPRKKISPAATR